MTPPRQILPDQNFEVCTRTMSRMLALSPTREVRQLFLYVLGVAAQRYSVSLFLVCALANHYHLAGRDNEGRLPDFMTYLNSTLARALNRLHRRDDKFWSGDGYHLLRPQTANDLLARAEYILANPASADLVARLDDYPGLASHPDDVGRDIEVRRPDVFFRKDGNMPETVTVRFEIPPELAHLGRDGYVALLKERLEERERELRAERKAEGRSVMGAKRLRQVRPDERAKSWEKWFRMRPTIAAKSREVRVAAIRAIQEFTEAYREAWRRFSEGEYDVVFPAGTWWVCRYASAIAAPPP